MLWLRLRAAVKQRAGCRHQQQESCFLLLASKVAIGSPKAKKATFQLSRTAHNQLTRGCGAFAALFADRCAWAR